MTKNNILTMKLIMYNKISKYIQIQFNLNLHEI